MSQPEDYKLGDSLSESSENCSEKVKAEASIYVILVKGYMKSITLVGYCYLRGTNILVNGFSAFLSVRRCKKPGS